MKNRFMAVIAGTAFALLIAVPLLYAQDFIIQEEVVAPDLKYMSGGVGIEERTAMESQAGKEYDLKLEFAVTQGNYLSYVDVKINDKTGKPVISAQSNGPWFYADLPKGTYTVVANHEGDQKSQKVTVNGGLKRVVFHFKPDQAMGEEPKAGGVTKQRKPGQTGKSK